MVGRYDSTLDSNHKHNKNDTPEGYGALAEDAQTTAYNNNATAPVPPQAALANTKERDGILRIKPNNSDDNSAGSAAGLRDGLMVDIDTDHDDDSDNGDGDDDDDEDVDFDISLAELLYSSSSYYAIAKPVALTMSLALIHI